MQGFGHSQGGAHGPARARAEEEIRLVAVLGSGPPDTLRSDDPRSGAGTASRWEPHVTVIDNAIYIDGKRAIVPQSLDQTFEELRTCTDTPGHCFCWIGLLRPSKPEIDAVAGVQPAWPRRRGHRQGPPATEA